MRVKTIIDEDFTNYKLPAMVLGTISCHGKCCIEAGLPLSICQNDGWRSRAPFTLDDEKLCERYMSDPITQAVVFGGLEPFEQFNEMTRFIATLRDKFHCDDTVVIYTGYTEEEVRKEVEVLRKFKNIIVKFGRYLPGQTSHYDEVLGVSLASDNQYAKQIS